MKAIIYNTGPDTDGIKTGEKKVVALEVAEVLSEKWSGMMKVLPYEEPEVIEAPKKTAPKVAKKESIIKKTIKKLKK